MNVGVDGGAVSVFDKRLKVGVYKVVERLLENLSQTDSNIYYRIYTYGAGEGSSKIIKKGKCHWIRLPRLGFNEIQIPVSVWRDRLDAYLGVSQIFPGFRMTSLFGNRLDPLFRRTRMIGFIYDLCFLYHPDAYPDSHRKLRQQTADLVARASHIVTISQASKNDILSRYNYPSERIHVLYPGIDEIFLRARPKKLKKTAPYFLFVGALKRAKNIPVLLQAFRRFSVSAHKKFSLRISGGDYWFDDRIKSELKKSRLGDLVEFTGQVSDDELVRLYQNATAFVSPSLREGFCLPAIEALASGCPVIGSNTGAIPEVVGQAGILTDPFDTDGLANAMSVMADPAKRQSYVRRIRPNLTQMFSWSTFARGVERIIME